MAELLLKVGTNGVDPAIHYQDGDVLCAFNRRAIRCKHAEHICDRMKARGGSGTARDPRHPARLFYEITHQFKNERLTFDTVLQTETATGRTAIITAAEELVDGVPMRISIDRWIKNRLRHPRHKIFGRSGSEVWYSGRKDFSNAKMDEVWAMIEGSTAFRERNFTRWPAQRRELCSYLLLPTSDFSDERAAHLCKSEMDLTDPASPKIVRKRVNYLLWKDHVPSIRHADVEDMATEVDLREDVPELDETAAVRDVTLQPRTA